jgi:hypothetical protein
MALCAVANSEGVLIVDNVSSLTACTGYVLVTPDDKIAFLERIFDPNFLSADNYQLLFSLGFFTPVLAYLTAWAFREIIVFIEERT